MIRSTGRVAARLLRWLFAVVAIIVIIAAARLAWGPVPLDFLTSHIERVMNEPDDDLRMEIERTYLRWGGWDDPLVIVGRGVVVTQDDGTVVLTVPEFEIGLDGSALLRGDVRIRSLDILAPELLLVRDDSGRIGLGLRHQTDDEQEPIPPAPETGPMAALERISVRDASLQVADALTGLAMNASNVDLTIVELAGELAGNASLVLAQEAGPSRLDVTVNYRLADASFDAQVWFRELQARTLQIFVPDIGLAPFDMTADGTITAAVVDGAAVEVGLRLDSAKGEISMPDRLERDIAVDALSGSVTWIADGRRLFIEGASLRSGQTSFSVDAEAMLGEDGPTVTAEVGVRALDAADLPAFWPPGVVEKGRDWVLEHIETGFVPEGEVRLHITPDTGDAILLPDGTLDARFTFEDLTVHYFPPMPPATGLAGEARVRDMRWDFTATAGQVGNIVVHGGEVDLNGIGAKPDIEYLRVLVDGEGPVPDILRLIDEPPLGLAQEFGIDPDATGGSARADLSIEFPLREELEVEDIVIGVRATVSDGRAAGLIPDVEITNAALALDVDKHGMRIAGETHLNGIPMRIAWDEWFADDARIRRAYSANGTMTVEQLGTLGVDLQGMAQGSIAVDAKVEVPAGGGTRTMVAADLAGAEVTVPTLTWSKAAGTPGTVSATLTEVGDGAVEITDIVATAPGLEIKGSARVLGDPVRLEVLRLDPLIVGDKNLTLIVRQTPELLDIAIAGNSIDLRPLLAGDESGAAGPEAGDLGALELDVDVREAIISDHIRIADLSGYIARDPAGWQRVSLSAIIGGSAETTIELAPENGTHALLVKSTDAGATLHGLDVDSNVVGGRLRVEGTVTRMEPTVEMNGRFVMREFTVVEAPVLARLLTVASLTGILNLLTGEGIAFDSLKLPYTFADNVITFEDGLLSGSQIGVTAHGTVDLNANTLNLRGVVIPAHGVSRALSKIPLLGTLLTGTEGGLFGANYRIRGPIEDPEVSVSALSALAPGIVRDLISSIREGRAEEPEIPEARD